MPPVFANAISAKKAKSWSLGVAYFLGGHIALAAVYYSWRRLFSKKHPIARRQD